MIGLNYTSKEYFRSLFDLRDPLDWGCGQSKAPVQSGAFEVS
jgi:hypothetical protein